MELEKAGECYEPQLKRLARNVLRQRYTDGVIDEMLAPERVSYEDLARASSDTSSAEPPSILKSIFHEHARERRASCGVARERRARRRNRSKGGDPRADEAGAFETRACSFPMTRHCRSSDPLRFGTSWQENSGAISAAPHRRLSTPYRRRRQRMKKPQCESSPGVFARASPRPIQRWPIAWRPSWGFATPKLSPDGLGSIDTFRFEERALLAHCGDLIAAKQFDQALAIISGREHSFWLDRDVGRKAQWEACRRMAELGRLCVSVRAAVSKAGGDANAWIDAYTSKDGWFRLDQAQRRLEAWVANLDDEPEERPLGVVRGAYEDACRAMADGFTKAMVRANWTVASVLAPDAHLQRDRRGAAEARGVLSGRRHALRDGRRAR